MINTKNVAVPSAHATHSFSRTLIAMPSNAPAFTLIPKGLRVGKKIYSKRFATTLSQLFVECAGTEPECHDTIALIPKSKEDNAVITATSSQLAGKIFAAYGWMVKGYNSNHYSRCPVCKLKLPTKE